MGILQRFADIMSANVNSFIEGLESKNAEKLLEQYLREAKDNFAEVKSETAAIIADEMAASRKLTAANEEIAKYDRYAEAAVTAGNDGDALKFLNAKAQLAERKPELEAAYETAKKNSDMMRQLSKKLVGDIVSAEAKLTELKAKLTIAESKEKMEDLKQKIAGMDPLGSFENMVDAVQKRIDEVDAKAALNQELSDPEDMKALEQKYSVGSALENVKASADAELAALKARLGK